VFGLFKKKETPVQDTWAIAKGLEDSLPVLCRYRTSVPPMASEFATLVNLYWRYIPGREQGMPGSDDYERMLQLEEELEKMESSGAGFVALSITGNSRKEWVFYSRSDDSFLDALNKQLAGQLPYPIEIETEADPSWQALLSLHARAGSA